MGPSTASVFEGGRGRRDYLSHTVTHGTFTRAGEICHWQATHFNIMQWEVKLLDILQE